MCAEGAAIGVEEGPDSAARIACFLNERGTETRSSATHEDTQTTAVHRGRVSRCALEVAAGQSHRDEGKWTREKRVAPEAWPKNSSSLLCV